MTYRGDEEALRARVEQLEGRLEEAEETIAKLRGRTPPAATGTTLTPSRYLGTTIGIVREEELPYAIADAGYEKIAQLLRDRLQIQVVQVGKTLHAPGAFSLTTEDGRTRIRLSQDMRQLAGGAIALTAMSAILPGLPVLGVLLDTGHPMHALWALPAVVVGAGVLARRMARKNGAARIEEAQGTFAAILEVAEAHAVRAPKVRVEEPGDELEPAERQGERAREA